MLRRNDLRFEDESRELHSLDAGTGPAWRPGDGHLSISALAHVLSVDAALSINHSRRMDVSRATTIMSALAQPTRLRTFRLLVEQGEAGLASGAIAAAVGAPQNTMSSHLTILTHAGLLGREQEGRVVRYRALLDEVAELGPFLTA
jgi:ArsR family transcriptional regulator, arsenate/arsenite/antimonite-responsive transcriptional repressor